MNRKMAQDTEKAMSTGQQKKVVGKGKAKAKQTVAARGGARQAATTPAKTAAARKTSAGKPAEPKKAAVGKTAATRASATKAASSGRAKTNARRPGAPKPITREERYRLVAEAAYLRAERRRFEPGGEVNDWFEAEAEVDALLRSKGVNLVD